VCGGGGVCVVVCVCVCVCGGVRVVVVTAGEVGVSADRAQERIHATQDV